MPDNDNSVSTDNIESVEKIEDFDLKAFLAGQMQAKREEQKEGDSGGYNPGDLEDEFDDIYSKGSSD